MPKDKIRLFEGRPILDIRSLGRNGPGRRHVSPTEADVMRRTLNRDPEVLVKVVSKGGQDLKAVESHLGYVGRQGEVEIMDDDGGRHGGKEAAILLIADWNLDLQEHRSSFALRPTAKGKPPKLVHKLIFSMPPGTAPQKVLAAVKSFAREEFALQHRYAMAMHTDEPQPHVHLVVKAVSEHGIRLNIRKVTLRMWRSEFARHLREQGVRANATDRLSRGRTGRSLPDGAFRANERHALTRIRLQPDAPNDTKSLARWAAVGREV
jgi:Relaxase/Mobilisation nuclease domain